ncbi:hypothetical protein OG900_33130 [Streptomyces sp. NBC_00433]
MGSSLRRDLREVLPPSIKGLPRAVALEIADDARWDDGWRYNPETGRRSKATLTDLVRWTAAKNERVVRDALRNLALAGWEFRVPFGKGADGRLLYAVPGRAAEFRVPDFEAPLIETEETVVTVSSSSPETVATAEEAVTAARETVTTAYEAVTTVSEAVVTGPPSHVSKSHQDPTSSLSEPCEPAVDPDVTEGGGGGGSDLRSIAEHITASLEYLDQVPDKQQRQQLTAAFVAVLEKGWTMQGLAYYLHLGNYRPDNPVAFYLSKLTKKLPDTVPASPPPAAGGIRGAVASAEDYANLTLEDVLGGGRRDAADGGMWERAMGRAHQRMGSDTLTREHTPYSNDIWSRPATPEETAGIPWCGEVECEPIGRLREHIDHNGIKTDHPCEKCHPAMQW